MKTRIWFLALFTTMSLWFVGCGGSSGGSSNSSEASSSSVSSASSSASSSVAGAVPKTLVAAEILVEAGIGEQILDVINREGLAKAAARSKERTDVSAYACPDGGSADITDNTATFNQCKKDGTTLNGVIEQNESGSTVQFNNFSFDDGKSFTLLDGTVIVNSTSDTVYTITFNGTYEHTENGMTKRMMFSNFEVSQNGNQFTFKGEFSIQNDPDDCGVNGNYEVDTPVPLTIEDDGCISAGEIKVNADTFVFDNCMVSSNGGDPVSVSDLLDTCTA